MLSANIHTNNYNYVFLFFIGAFAFAVVVLIASILLGPKRPSVNKLIPYECGEIPYEDAWSRVNFRYYLFALMFLIFDVEIIFLIPWALVYKGLLFGFSVPLPAPLEQYTYNVTALGMSALGEMVLFIVMLLVGWIYALKKGAMEWV